MDSLVNISPACRSFVKCGYFNSILFSLLIFTCITHNGEASKHEGIRKAYNYVMAGEDASLKFPGYGTKMHPRCLIKRYEIWARGTYQLTRILASNFGSGTDTWYVGDCKKRGSIKDDSENVTLTLMNARKCDQKQYCLKIICSGSDDVSSCESEEISLIVIEPVTQLNHTLIGSSPVIKLGGTVQGICTANGDPPPDMKIINNNTGDVVKEGRTNNLSYSVQIKQRQRQITLICEAKNNPAKMPISQILRVDYGFISYKVSYGEKINYCNMLLFTISVITSVSVLI